MDAKILIDSFTYYEKQSVFLLLKNYFEKERVTIGEWANNNKDEISMRLYNCLVNLENKILAGSQYYKHDLLYIDDLDFEDLRKVRNFGTKTLREFFTKLYNRDVNII
jgi:hypothetical protein